MLYENPNQVDHELLLRRSDNFPRTPLHLIIVAQFYLEALNRPSLEYKYNFLPIISQSHGFALHRDHVDLF